MMNFLDLLGGFIVLPWWGYVLVALACTHITIICVTLYLHRCQTHRAIDLHPIVSHFFRLWLWLTTGMNTKGWTAVHRKHHAKVETEEDPHSPQVYGLRKVLLEGAELYRQESTCTKTLEKYGHGTPNDWIEKNIYTPRPNSGTALSLIIMFLLFGFAGLSVWAVQMAWIPFFAAGVINGIGHHSGYRNFGTPDTSTNVSPIGILVGGEELHNNHHAYASSAKFSYHWWEFDIGYMYISILKFFGLARVRKLAPMAKVKTGIDNVLDEESLRAIVTNRLDIMYQYAQKVVKPIYKEEAHKQVSLQKKKMLHQNKKMLIGATSTSGQFSFMQCKNEKLHEALKLSDKLQQVHEFRIELQKIWAQKTWDNEKLLQALRHWCEKAEQSGIDVLRSFSMWLKQYSIKNYCN